MPPATIERRIAFMNAAFDTAMITGYEHLAPGMTNQVKDRHLLTAAVACDADRIITCNADTGRHGPRLAPLNVLAYLTSAGAHQFAQFAQTVRPYIPEKETKLSGEPRTARSRYRVVSWLARQVTLRQYDHFRLREVTECVERMSVETPSPAPPRSPAR